MYHLSIPQLTVFLFVFSVSLCPIHSFQRQKLPQRRRGDWSRDFIILPLGLRLWEASYLIMQEKHLLLTSFPLTSHLSDGFKLTAQSYVIMAHFTPGSPVSPQIKDPVHVWRILPLCSGFWNQFWIPEEGSERRASLCDNSNRTYSRWSFLVWIQENLLSTAVSFLVNLQVTHRDSFTLLHHILVCITSAMSDTEAPCICQSCIVKWHLQQILLY